MGSRQARWSPNSADTFAGHDEARSMAIDRAVLEGTHDPLVVIDAKGTVRFASRSCERVLGWPPAEFVGQNISVLMPEPYRSAHDQYLERYLRTGHTGILDRTRRFECVHYNGRCLPIELSVSRVDVRHNEPPLFVGVIRDITEAKRLERELRLMQDLALGVCGAHTLATAAEATIAHICDATGWDLADAWLPIGEGNLERVATWRRPGVRVPERDRTFGNVRGVDGADLVGRGWTATQPLWFDDLARLARCRCSVDAQAAGFGGACVAPVRCDGDPVALLVFFVRPFQARDDGLLELIRAAIAPLGTLIHRRTAEEALAASQERLKALVRERTEALERSHDQLRMAERLAAMGTLAAGLGHDMSNVLLPMRAHANAMRGAASGGPAAEHAEEVAAGVAYLQQLADGLHYLAMDPEAPNGSAGPTDLARWWTQVGGLLSKAVPRHVRLTTAFADRCPAVAIAPHRLTQAVLNLIVNAGEAINPPGSLRGRSGRIRVSSRLKGQMVRLMVSDNGRGMDPETQRRAFEMFFTTKQRGMGTGLGLALVQRIAENAGGTVGLRSRPGVGTSVEMLLPAAPAAQPLDRPTVAFSIAPGRARTLLAQFFEDAGARLVQDNAQSADIWVARAAQLDAKDVVQWRAKHPSGRLVLIGTAEDQDTGFEPAAVAESTDFEALRRAVTRAMQR